ncbi:hypothetical protein ABW19_dt0203270 [Dactylella cylindrospora]|nr:hypothetical protein ABW19_dt0203270 [Dactylella cylindrospora]
MGVYTFGPIAMDNSFIYTFFPLLAIVLALFYVKNKEMDEKSKAAFAASPYSLWVPKSTEKMTKKPPILPIITPIQNFDIYATAPYPFRPYKPIYHMSMGLEKLSPDDLFLLDSSYPSRIALRKELISKYASTTLGASAEIAVAVRELYSYILSHHLPTRFPGYFTANQEYSTFTNCITNSTHSLEPPESSVAALGVLATTVEEDILVLKRDPKEDIYRLHAFVACFPSGFDSSKKMGLALRDIHAPVPLYREKLALSMDRFFSKLEVGRWVKRLNWTITTHNKLFVPSGNHVYVDEEIPEELPAVDLDKTYLRVERQTLLRLPKSKAMIFFVKTYLTPLSEIKAEGQGEALATAIEDVDNIKV